MPSPNVFKELCVKITLLRSFSEKILTGVFFFFFFFFFWGGGEFVEDNATMSSIRYFENHACILCKTEGSSDPIKLISLQQISLSIALKYIINNSV